MNTDNTKRLIEKYPRLYGGDGYCVEGGSSFKFDCGDGWYAIIDRLSAAIEFECQRLVQERDVTEDQLPTAFQIKQKWGGLCFYTNGNTVTMSEAIATAVAAAEHTCELCGAPGVLREYGRVIVACDACDTG